MLSALAGSYLALELKGVSQWDPKTQAFVCIVVLVLAIVGCVTLVRKVGIFAILVPLILIGAMYAMNTNGGCLEHATDVNKAGTYEKAHSPHPTPPTPPPK